jgi:putative flavoprotein involved in K+ transport
MSTSLRTARAVDVVVIGAGHAGLAMSRLLAELGIDHAVLERGTPGQSWRTGRWDSLRLLTPNWMTRLPGRPYQGHDPDGYMRAAQVADLISAYARQIAAPVHAHTIVTGLWRQGDGYRVATTRGDWHCRAAVLAHGAFGLPVPPPLAAQVPRHVAQWSARDYRNPAQLPEGGVLVVGASATGVQWADEIQRSGRPVVLAVGEHVRLPRLYRGRDIQWWMHAAGVLDQRIEQTPEPDRARRVASPQLIGSDERRTLDLNALQSLGVEIVGRLAGIRGNDALFSGSLRNVCALADMKMERLLDALDAWAARSGQADEAGPFGQAGRLPPTRLAPSVRLGLRLGVDVRAIVWATGFRPDYHWLHLPVFDHAGALRHDRGVVAPGLYVLGLPFLRRRKSSFIHGAEDDVRDLGAHLAAHLGVAASRDSVQEM